jgi:gliding motility-associated-like protein
VFFSVPNSVTPTGDGINDEFFPVIDGFTPLSYNMMIFNRWGELISKSDNIDNKWNGIDSRNGSECKSDVYVWKIEVRDNVTSELKYFQGHVTLLR